MFRPASPAHQIFPGLATGKCPRKNMLYIFFSNFFFAPFFFQTTADYRGTGAPARSPPLADRRYCGNACGRRKTPRVSAKRFSRTLSSGAATALEFFASPLEFFALPSKPSRRTYALTEKKTVTRWLRSFRTENNSARVARK